MTARIDVSGRFWNYYDGSGTTGFTNPKCAVCTEPTYRDFYFIGTSMMFAQTVVHAKCFNAIAPKGHKPTNIIRDPLRLSGQPKLPDERVGVLDVLAALADTMSFTLVQKNLDVTAEEIRVCLDYVTKVFERAIYLLEDPDDN